MMPRSTVNSATLSFGEGARGALYICSSNRGVYIKSPVNRTGS
jgi:hypothetical protein